MSLDKFIEENIELLLEEWDRFAGSLVAANMDLAALRDHARLILNTIAANMRVEESREKQKQKSWGNVCRDDILRTSLKHAGGRLEEGLNLDEIISEYRALRASVIRLWTKDMKSADRDMLYELTRFNEAIDQILTETVQEYSKLAEQKRQEFLNELQESEQRFRSLAELSPEAILVNQQGSYVYANTAAAQLLDAGDAQDLLGLTTFDILEPEYHEMVRKRIREVLEKQAPVPPIEYRWTGLSGRTIEVETVAGYNKWGGEPAVHVLARDITQRKAEGKALEEANRHKGEFLTSLAHELRNPLALLQNGFAVLRSQMDDADKSGLPLEMMERQTRHMKRLVDDLMDISRIDLGKLQLHLQAVDIRDVIHQSVEASRSLMDCSKRQVSLQLSPDPITVKGDEIRLGQVFTNLFNNAMNFTRENGRIWISAHEEKGWARLSWKRHARKGDRPSELEGYNAGLRKRCKRTINTSNRVTYHANQTPRGHSPLGNHARIRIPLPP